MTTSTPKSQEEYSAKLPVLALLTHLGWSFLSPEQALTTRGGKLDEVVLRDELRRQLQKRRFTFASKKRALSEAAIDTLIAEVCSPALNEGLRTANEKMYNHLLYGLSVPEFVDGKKASPTVALVDWHNPSNNSFLFTEGFTISRTGGIGMRRPDIVCFVNGIPLVVIEIKRPDGSAQKGPTIEAGISQSLRNQRHDEIPLLFAYNQLLLSINGSEGRYGTCGTPAPFWAAWREEEIVEAQMRAYKNTKLSEAQITTLFSHRPAKDLDWYQTLVSGGDLAVSEQDRLLVSLLQPARLLEMVRFFTLFDKKAGKIVARHQQVFGVKRLIERITTKRPDGGRQGGVIWHTTGSGKSFTMMFLSKSLILHDALKQCRLVVITDRVDLENQLSNTFASGGELAGKKDRAAAIATSGTRLAEQIGQGTERIIFSLIQKFNSAAKLPLCRNPSSDIVVLIDEGHRCQDRENNIRMHQALPNAAFVAFTGTPLLKDDKTTDKFGPIIHTYTMQRAVEDKVVTPLLYEERIPDLDANERAIDSWFERITEGLSDQQRGGLKRKFAKKDQVYSADDRIRLIALDVANHFAKHIGDGLKGQLACDSKASAIKYKQYLDEAGLFESAVVISLPDTCEGNTALDESTAPEVTQWWRKNVGSEDEQVYAKRMIQRFTADENSDDAIKMLIVVDKLLAGFDEPKNTVLYIDKPLKSHNLIQAVARVNRLHPQKEFGLLIDYRGILAELDTTIQKYQDLASRTQGGFDINDIAGLYSAMSTEYRCLPQLYKNLWAIFSDVKDKGDIEQLRQVLIPKIEDRDSQWVDVHIKIRENFYEALTAFAKCLKVALQSTTFFKDTHFSDADRRHYIETIKQLSNLRQLARRDASETIEYDAYAQQSKRLMDRHAVRDGVKDAAGLYKVGKAGQRPKAESWSDNKIRNETDIIKTRVTRMIEQELRDDPYAQEVFSYLLRQAIEEAEALFDHPLKQYMLFNELEEQVKTRKLDEIPDAFAGNHHAQAYFGVFKKALPQVLAVTDQQILDKWVDIAFTIDDIVETSVANHSINPQNIEADIRKQLLPVLYKECKAIGAGMDQTKAIIEYVVQITRMGLGGI